MTLKDIVKGGNKVYFEYYRQGVFYYYFWFPSEDEWPPRHKYIFPVPLDDISTSSLQYEDKAITFMRWIRKAINDKTLIRI